MGAWGTGILQDDTALDFLEDELEGDSNPSLTLERTFMAVGDEPDYEEGCAALVGAHLLRCVVRDEPLDPGQFESEGRRRWRQSLAAQDFSGLYPLAVAAIERIVRPGSELYDLWEENQEEFPVWRDRALELRDFLASRARA